MLYEFFLDAETDHVTPGEIQGWSEGGQGMPRDGSVSLGFWGASNCPNSQMAILF